MTPRKMILLSADLSQIEIRVELMLAAATPEFAGTDVAKECVRLATAVPWEFDLHRYSASIAFAKSEADVKDTDDEPERFMGKTTMHGFSRGMGAQTMADSLLKQGYVVTPEECARRLGRLAAKLPAIPEGYFPDVRRQMMRFRSLGSTFGGIWRCDWQRFDEHLYGTGYSYQPVRETVDLINQCGYLPLRNAINLRRLNPHPNRPTPRIHIHAHDALVISVHPDDAWIVMEFLERTLANHVRHYAAGALQVPLTYGLGSTWKSRFDLKRLPSKEKVLEMAWACAEEA